MAQNIPAHKIQLVVTDLPFSTLLQPLHAVSNVALQALTGQANIFQRPYHVGFIITTKQQDGSLMYLTSQKNHLGDTRLNIANSHDEALHQIGREAGTQSPTYAVHDLKLKQTVMINEVLYFADNYSQEYNLLTDNCQHFAEDFMNCFGISADKATELTINNGDGQQLQNTTDCLGQFLGGCLIQKGGVSPGQIGELAANMALINLAPPQLQIVANVTKSLYDLMKILISDNMSIAKKLQTYLKMSAAAVTSLACVTFCGFLFGTAGALCGGVAGAKIGHFFGSIVGGCFGGTFSREIMQSNQKQRLHNKIKSLQQHPNIIPFTCTFDIKKYTDIQTQAQRLGVFPNLQLSPQFLSLSRQSKSLIILMFTKRGDTTYSNAVLANMIPQNLNNTSQIQFPNHFSPPQVDDDEAFIFVLGISVAQLKFQHDQLFQMLQSQSSIHQTKKIFKIMQLGRMNFDLKTLKLQKFQSMGININVPNQIKVQEFINKKVLISTEDFYVMNTFKNNDFLWCKSEQFGASINYIDNPYNWFLVTQAADKIHIVLQEYNGKFVGGTYGPKKLVLANSKIYNPKIHDWEIEYNYSKQEGPWLDGQYSLKQNGLYLSFFKNGGGRAQLKVAKRQQWERFTLIYKCDDDGSIEYQKNVAQINKNEVMQILKQPQSNDIKQQQISADQWQQLIDSTPIAQINTFHGNYQTGGVHNMSINNDNSVIRNHETNPGQKLDKRLILSKWCGHQILLLQLSDQEVLEIKDQFNKTMKISYWQKYPQDKDSAGDSLEGIWCYRKKVYWQNMTINKGKATITFKGHRQKRKFNLQQYQANNKFILVEKGKTLMFILMNSQNSLIQIKGMSKKQLSTFIWTRTKF